MASAWRVSRRWRHDLERWSHPLARVSPTLPLAQVHAFRAEVCVMDYLPNNIPAALILGTALFAIGQALWYAYRVSYKLIEDWHDGGADYDGAQPDLGFTQGRELLRAFGWRRAHPPRRRRSRHRLAVLQFRAMGESGGGTTLFRVMPRATDVAERVSLLWAA